MELAPIRFGEDSYFTLFSPYDCTIDKNEVRTIRTGITLRLPAIVEQRKSTNVINVSKYSIGALLAPYTLLADKGMVLISPTFVVPNYPVDLVFQNFGKRSFDVKKGSPIAVLTFMIVPNVRLSPKLQPLPNES